MNPSTRHLQGSMHAMRLGGWGQIEILGVARLIDEFIRQQLDEAPAYLSGLRSQGGGVPEMNTLDSAVPT